jgi:hypothetical protein
MRTTVDFYDSSQRYCCTVGSALARVGSGCGMMELHVSQAVQ